MAFNAQCLKGTILETAFFRTAMFVTEIQIVIMALMNVSANLLQETLKAIT